MSKFTLQEGMLFVTIEEVSKEQYKENSSGILLSDHSKETAHTWRDCIIVETSDELKYPKGSRWMIGTDPGAKIDYHGTTYTLIQTRNLKAKINE